MADALIRELIQTRRAASAEEIQQIVERIAAAPFDQTIRRVPVRDRGLSYQGRILAAREDALFYHLVKRVLLERQWTGGTTVQEYLDDLRRAIVWPTARLVVYHRSGEHFAAVAAPTEDVVPPARRGEDNLTLLLVVYSADRGVIITGYQFSGWLAVDIPGDASWLK